jgi:hypothetical protein
MVTSIPIVEEVLDQYATALGQDFIGYRNHVHRVVNLCLAVTPGSRDHLEKIAVAAAFHDLGIWTAHTWDYIAPSVSLAREYLVAHPRDRSDDRESSQDHAGTSPSRLARRRVSSR